MRVIAKPILREFWEVHADSEQQLKAWFQEAKKSKWKSPNDIKNMDIRAIKTEQDYKKNLKRLEEIFDAKLGSKEGDELEVLSILIDVYENEYYPIELPDPIEAIIFRMEQLGFSQKDFEEVVGMKGRAYEILSRKRKLSLDMIRRLHERMQIPTDVLIQSY